MGQIVKFVELVHDCILSKQQRNEMNRRYCDAITAPHLPCSQLLSIQATAELVQQEFGGFSNDLVIGYKVFFLMDSCSIGIVFQESG